MKPYAGSKVKCMVLWHFGTQCLPSIIGGIIFGFERNVKLQCYYEPQLCNRYTVWSEQGYENASKHLFISNVHFYYTHLIYFSTYTYMAIVSFIIPGDACTLAYRRCLWGLLMSPDK